MANQYKTAIILTGDSKGAVTATKATQAELRKLGATGKKTAQETVSAFDQLKASLFSVQGVMTAVAGGAFVALIKRQIDMGDQVQKLSQRLGASTEALSQYQYIAERTGVTFETLTMGWQRQTRRIAEAAAGTGEAKKALDEMGLSAKSLMQLAPERQFEIIADSIMAVEDASKRVALAQKIWDSEGVKLLQTIQGGSKALIEMRQAADDAGRTISRVQADDMAAMNDQLTDMASHAEGFALSISTWMIPALSNLLGYLTSAADGVRDLLTEMGVIETKSKSYIIGARLEVMKEIQDLEKIIAGEAGERKAGSVGGMIAQFFGAEMKELDTKAANKHLSDLHVKLQDLNDEMRLLQTVSGTDLPKAMGGTGLGGATDKLKARVSGVSKEIDTFAKELQSLLDELDPVAKKTREYLKNVDLLNRAWVEGVISGEEWERLFFQLASGVEQASQKTKEAVVVMEQEADPFAEAWVGAIERVDDAFADMWKGAFESFEDFADALKNAFMQLLAELAHAAITRPLIIQPLMGALGMGGAGGAAGGAGGLLNIAGMANSFWGSGVGSTAGGLLGGLGVGAGAGTALESAMFMSAPFGSIGAGGIAGTGIGGLLGSALPFVGAGIGLLSLFGGGMFEDSPSPHFGATGGLGQLGQNYERDLDEQQAQQVTQMIAQLNTAEQAFLAMLTDAQLEALDGYVPPDLQQVHFESEHELAAHMLYRAQEALQVADEELGKQWTDAVNEIWSTRGAPGVEFFTMADYDRLVADIILPQFEAAQEAAEKMREEFEAWIATMEEQVSAIEDMLSDLGDLLSGAGDLREKINTDLIAFGGREAQGIEGLAAQVYSDLNTADLDAVRERLAIADEYRALVVSTYNEQIKSVEQMAQAEKTRIEAIQAAGSVLVRWAQDAMASPALSGIGIRQQPLAAGAQYSTLLAMGRAGDLDSVSRIPGAAQTYLSSLMGTSVSRTDYRRRAAGVFEDVGGLGGVLESAAYNEEAWRAEIEKLQSEANGLLYTLDENIEEIESVLIRDMDIQNALLFDILNELKIANGSEFDASSQDWTNSGPGFGTVKSYDYVAPGGDLYDPPTGFYWKPTELGYELRPIDNTGDPNNVWVDPWGQLPTQELSIGPNSGFASGGVATGPSSGYYALLHGTEMITPINRNGRSPINMSEVVAELKALRAETKDLKSLSLKNTIAVLKTADTNDKWDRDGMPAERVI